MSDELKPCPWCGEVVETGFCGQRVMHDCVVLGGLIACSVAAWNARAAVADEQFAMAVHGGLAWQAVRECRMSPARGGGWYCSECSVWVAPGPMANATEHLAPRYCPNCGAKVVV